MNVGDENSVSVWMAEPAIEAPPLTSDVEADVAVVGAGIAGLSTAYELARLGRSVVVIDRGRIVADDPPAAALNPERIREVFGVDPALVRLSA